MALAALPPAPAPPVVALAAPTASYGSTSPGLRVVRLVDEAGRFAGLDLVPFPAPSARP
ncbi:hypothetical protein [Terrabacter sp. Root85]|uniref:hypothetical protein n=1 Tax=Terrabacter sp. Root85 TaxID=1736603 RepID=UPI000B06F044|nr:hypothetical protein [Terrabacter sp. Root85]